MRKILSFVAAMLVALVANAQTDFASPGYYCTADAGVISGDAPSDKVYLDATADPHHIAWSDVSKTYTAVVTWNVAANRACYISVSLDLGPAIASNKHIFEVKLLDAEGKELGALEEGPAYTGDGFTEANQVKVLSGKLLIPAAGNYSIELRNNRDFCKGSIKNVILTYAGDAPVTDFAAPGFSCAADDGVITGDAPSDKVYLDATADPHHIAWSDVSKTYTAAVEWKVIATRACYVTVGLDLGPAIASNKHIFDVELYDANGNRLDTIAEGPAYTGDGFTEANQVKTLDGQLLIPEAGEYTIKLKNNRDFCKGSIKNVILTYAAPAPVPPTPQPADTTIVLDYSAKGYTNGQDLDGIAVVENDVTFTLAIGTGANGPKYYTTGTGARTYAGNLLTVDAGTGKISKIKFGFTQNNNDYSVNTGTYVKNDSTWTGSASVVTFTTGGASGHNRIKTIAVTYEPGVPPAVVNPVITADAFFYDTTLVTITCDTEGAAIYYTLDGTEPTAASTPYTAAFNLTASATVKAIAILGDDASAIVEKTFTKNPSFASFEELIAAGLADNTLVEVSFANLVIDSIYVSSQNAHKGVYFTVDGAAYEIYYSNGDAAVPAEWVVGGKVSGTIRGNWTVYKGLWELVPTAPWAWANLTYAAPVTGCDWDNIEFLGGPAEYANQFKVCVGDPAPTQVVNIQQPDWATKLGIFMSFPAAPISAVSLGEGNYAVDGAGCVLYVSAFTAKETEVTITANNVDYVVTVYNANGTEPIIGGPNYYLVGSMNNWTPGLTDVFEANPGSEGEYMAKATLAVGDEFKVIGITSGVLNPDTTWYPEGTNNNYIVDVDHAGAAKNIYFRPDGQGGEGWHYGVIFVEPNQDALKAVSDSTTWNFSKLTQNTESSLYSSDKEGILLSASTNPSITDELIYAGYDSLWTIAEGFDGEAIAFTGEYPIRKNQYCMNGKLRIKTTVAGNIYVKFSDTGTSASDNPTRRYLMVNGDSTEYWTSRPKKNDDDYESRLNVETGAIHVPAGDVIITGSQAICVYYVTFVPDAAPIVNYYVAGTMNDWKADENYMLTPNNESLYEGEFTFVANDEFKVIGYDGSNTTWFPTGDNNNFKITEAGDYKITFNPAGNVEGWYAGYFNVVMKEAPVPVVPTTAPAAPTAAEDDVMAIYCNHYATNNLHFEILGWGGVTTWHADTIDGVAIVHCQDMTYEFLTNWGAASYDMSAYKKLHADLWAPAASTIRLGIEALGDNNGGSGFKSGVVCTLAEGWNSFDIEFSQEPDLANYSFTDVKYIFFEWYKTPEGESFENNPFGFANIYFYDKAPEGIENLFVEGKAVKVLYNGQILILKNNKVYTVTGQPVNMK